MRHLKRSVGILAVFAGSLCALPAGATTWTDTGLSNGQVGVNPGGTTQSSNPCYTTGSGAQNCQFTIVSGGQTLKVRAYSTSSSTSQNGAIRSAQIVNYTGGFGVTNATGDANEGTAPEHATDNQGSYDMLVFELPDSGFDMQAFMLGWAQEGSTATNEADLQMWFGGNKLADDFNFSTACINTGGCSNTGTSSAPTGGSFSYLGLTDITGLINNPNGIAGDNGLDTPINTTMNFDADTSGKYLVIAGKLGDTDDYFKVKSLTATPGGPGGSAPTPGTFALLGLGLFGLLAMRRRIGLV